MFMYARVVHTINTGKCMLLLAVTHLVAIHVLCPIIRSWTVCADLFVIIIHVWVWLFILLVDKIYTNNFRPTAQPTSTRIPISIIVNMGGSGTNTAGEIYILVCFAIYIACDWVNWSPNYHLDGSNDQPSSLSEMITNSWYSISTVSTLHDISSTGNFWRWNLHMYHECECAGCHPSTNLYVVNGECISLIGSHH